MRDYAFIRFENSLQKAKEINDPKVTDIRYLDQIHLKPNEIYSIISSNKNGIVFATDYTAYVCDSCGNNLLDITNLFQTYEGLDINGNNQMYFEFLIKEDFGSETIRLKIVHITGEIYYSNGFVCTEDQINQTSLFTFRSYGYFQGTSYDVFDKYQNIRLKTWYDRPNNQSEGSEYFQPTTQNTISSRMMYKQSEVYQFDYINTFTYERANIMLISDVVYVDGVRITNKPQFSSEERHGNTSTFSSNVEFFKDYCDTYEFEPSLLVFKIISKSPQGIYQLGYPNVGFMTFSLPVYLKPNIEITLHNYSDDSIIETYTYSDIYVNENYIEITLPSGLGFGKWYFKVNSNTILDESQTFSFNGINDKDFWWFSVKNGDYSADDYLEDDYSIYQQ